MRLLNILVICALVLAASVVYKIKFNSTLQGARVAKLRNELRRERDAIAALRAEWAKLDTPGAHPGPGRPSPGAAADKAHAIRRFRSSAAASAGAVAVAERRSDRRDDRPAAPATTGSVPAAPAAGR